MAYIFISYNRESEVIVRTLAVDIQALGHTVWFDQELSGGQVWWDQILAKVRDCEIFVFALSPEALNSIACKREYGYAADLGKPILPVMVSEGVSTNLLPPALSQIQFVDYRQQDRNAAFRLARAIISVPPPEPLPDPLPVPPEAPISYLGSLTEKIETTTTLSYEEQSALVVDLKRSLRNSKATDDARALLERLRKRRDLLATIADEIDELLASARKASQEVLERKAEEEKRRKEQEKITNSLGMKFVLIPSGSFMMGSPPGEKDRYKEEVQHKVTISKPFYLQTTQVTQGQWTSLMGDNPSKFKDCGDTCPVEKVSWEDTQQFIKKLNRKENTDKYRLPTEAEWEYACRAGSTARFCFGDSGDQLTDYAWYLVNSGRTSQPVEQKKANNWGLYDMHGNVWEWCQDWYDENYYSQSPERDPKGPPSGEDRVLRGGSWYRTAKSMRSANRRRTAPDYRYKDIGFRVARA